MGSSVRESAATATLNSAGRGTRRRCGNSKRREQAVIIRPGAASPRWPLLASCQFAAARRRVERSFRRHPAHGPFAWRRRRSQQRPRCLSAGDKSSWNAPLARRSSRHSLRHGLGCESHVGPLTPGPSPARGEGNEKSGLRLRHFKTRADLAFFLLPSPLAGEGCGGEGVSLAAFQIPSATASQSSKTSLFQNRKTRKPCDRNQASRRVVLAIGLFVMLAAVQLDDQPPFEAHEIHDIISQRELPAKFQRLERPAAKFLPEKVLGLGRRRSEISGTVLVASHTSAPSPPAPLPRGERGARRGNRLRLCGKLTCRPAG